MSTIGPVTQQGVVSTQIEQVQRSSVPVSAESPRAVQESPPPPPPPVESGRGTALDTSA